MAALCLGAFSEKAQAYAAKMLEERGVKIHLHTAVKEVAAGHVVLSDGSDIPTHTVVWAGGLRASDLSGNVGLRPGHGGRLDVAADLTVPGLRMCYAMATSPTSPARRRTFCRNWRRSPSRPASGAPKIFSPTSNGEAAQAVRVFRQGHHGHDRPQRRRGRNRSASLRTRRAHRLHGVAGRARRPAVHHAGAIEAFVEWAWDYFSDVKGDQVLDRFSQEDIDLEHRDDPAKTQTEPAKSS